MVVLGIETSCDDTAVGVVEDGVVLSDITSTQLVHQKYGGVVPELASRAHDRLLIPVIKEALRGAEIEKTGIDGVAVTVGPGLVGALLVGLNVAKGLAQSLDLPLIGINHLEGHISSAFLSHKTLKTPFIALIVSGGHTELIYVEDFGSYRGLGQTRDDAAGEAFDKVAKLLGLGFPGGPAIDGVARTGDPGAVRFPRARLGQSLDFSFSGLKTAVRNYLMGEVKLTPQGIADIAASFQEAVVDVLVSKVERAADRLSVHRVVVVGGVAANQRLRQRLKQNGSLGEVEVYIPEERFCTDNGAMIAWAGWMRLKRGERSGLDLEADPSLGLA
ncbi:tRNA (adenosine(37)-N6)-threonylcarbamoyltransferase complex transferase subunit TsaD [candidate division KSB1 bacterium]|nr:tRNA (adenosine(37)-N6)-threonylcarbamoyltransferase complex transferase subunit TsaD [candidate division KSB1 bacterium]